MADDEAARHTSNPVAVELLDHLEQWFDKKVKFAILCERPFHQRAAGMADHHDDVVRARLDLLETLEKVVL